MQDSAVIISKIVFFSENQFNFESKSKSKFEHDKQQLNLQDHEI